MSTPRTDGEIVDRGDGVRPDGRRIPPKAGSREPFTREELEAELAIVERQHNAAPRLGNE
jgi:hypothetical protein